MIDKLKNILFFSDLDENGLRKIISISKLKKLNKNEILFFQGEKAQYLYILLEGKIKIYKNNLNSKEIVIHIFTPVTLVAEMAVLDKTNYPANGIALEDSLVLMIDFLKFEEFMKEGDLCYKIMISLIKKIKSLNNVIDNSLILDTSTTIAKFIYENSHDFNLLKQHQIADILNIKPETLSRKLKKFKDLGIIENKNGHLYVKNKELIKEYFEW